MTTSFQDPGVSPEAMDPKEGGSEIHLSIDREEGSGILSPFVLEKLSTSDPRWRQRMYRYQRRWRTRARKRRVLW